MKVHSRTVRRFLDNRLAMIGLTVLGILIVVAVFAPFLPLQNPNKQILAARLQGPSAKHWLGTDSLGRDLLARLMVASKVTLQAAAQAVAIAALLGIPTGLLAGYTGGWVDAVLSRLADALLSIPGLVLAFGIIGVLGTGLTNAMTAVGIIFSPTFFRVSRASAIDLKHENFIVAARSLGCSHRRILMRHLLPNASPAILVQVSFAASLAIVAEASLSFLGLGVKTPQSSWGSIIADGYKSIRTTMWPIVPPSVMISLSVLMLFFIGDGLREATARGSYSSSDRSTI